MLQVQVQLWPMGFRAGEETVATLDIVQISRPHYSYTLRAGNCTVCGSYELDCSAHRNPWQHINAVLTKEAPWLAKLGLNYCATSHDITPAKSAQ